MKRVVGWREAGIIFMRITDKLWALGVDLNRGMNILGRLGLDFRLRFLCWVQTG